jgi:predicted DsbA family dithiol-disulfide isomerase
VRAWLLALCLAATAHAAELDTKGLDEAQKKTLQTLLDKYPSPCGKAHSLATSLKSDPSCKRAPFAARYLVMLLSLGLTQKEAEEHYEERFVTPHVGTCRPGAPVRGDERAPITICEFADFQCTHCKATEPILKKLLEEYKGRVKVWFKNYPLMSIHPDARPAAATAIAAGWQNKFWPMHDLLFEHQENLGPAELEKLAKELQLDLNKLNTDLPAAAAKVDADHAEGQALGVSKTPTLFIDGREYRGPLKYENVKDWIDEALAARP